MDYFVSPKTTLGIMVAGNIRPKTDLLDYNSNQYDGGMKLDSITTGNTDGAYHWKNYSINLNMQHKFNNTGKTLTADVDHIYYHSDGTQLSPNYVYLPDSILSSSYGLLFTTPSIVNIWSAKADYTQPLKANARFDAGFKSSYVTNNNQLSWFDQSANTFVQDYSKSDHFIYNENINAAYINLVKEWKRWAVQGGLRMENSQAKGLQLGNPSVQDSSFTKSYTRVFPTFYLSYKLDSSGNNTLTLSLSSRVHRPNYQQLNPFLFYHDKYTYTGGNPALGPSYSHNFELRYNYKQYIGVTLTYGEDKYLSYGITQAIGNLFITRPQNFGTRKTVGIIPNFSFSPTKWWSANVSSVLLYFINKGNGISQALDKNTNLHEVEVFNQLHFNNGWAAEVTGFFPGRQTFGQSQGSPIYNISAGIQKTILHKQGTIRLKMDDIFNTMNLRNSSIGINQVSALHTGETDTRQVGISFSYRFGKEANARKRNHNTGGAGDEEKRAN